MREIRNLLVRGTNWIGDAILTIPALRELRRHMPGTRITLMVRPWVRAVFDDQEFLDAILECDTASREWLRLRENSALMARGVFDAVLLLPNALAPALQALAAGVPHRWGYATDARRMLLTRSVHKSKRLRRGHQSYHYLNLLHALDLSPIDYLEAPTFHPDASLSRPDILREKARKTAERLGIAGRPRLVAIHPGAFYGSAKRWFPERFARVADALASSHAATILILGSQGEAGIAATVRAAMRQPALSLAGKTRLDEIVHVLSQCDLVITNDSGPMHLAAALQIPQVAIFGSTDPRATAPLNPHARLLRKEVACSPCLLRECPLDLRCFDQVSTDEVIAAARERLDAQRTERQT